MINENMTSQTTATAEGNLGLKPIQSFYALRPAPACYFSEVV